MRFNVQGNINYCATVVELNEFITLPNCDNVKHAKILGNLVIVSKDAEVGTKGLFFPVETQLTEIFLKSNNLYREKTINQDPNKSGYFELNGRIRCVKFRGNSSEGFFIPLTSLDFICTCLNDELKVGDELDTVEGITICRKYIPVTTKIINNVSSQDKKVRKAASIKLVEDQFKFHIDTANIYKNIHRFNPDDLLSITYKIHGTSGITGNLLYNKVLTWKEKLAQKLKINVNTTFYGFVDSSRKVIKTKNASTGYYGVDIWTLAGQHLQPYVQKGMTFYYEIVGYLPTGKMIQKDYDYGYSRPVQDKTFEFGKHAGIYIYRITSTNVDGKVIEFSAKQVQDFCKSKGVNPVPELFYGRAKNLLPEVYENIDWWRKVFLDTLKGLYTDKDCYMCGNRVPEEGCVVRIESNDLTVFKCKSPRFLQHETTLLDKGEADIETEN